MCVTLEEIELSDARLSPEIDRCRAFDFAVCTVIIGVFCFLGLAGNITSFLVLTKHKTETSTIFLLQCLALSDSVLLGSTLIVYSLPGIYPYTHTLKSVFEACDEIKAYIWPVSMIAHTTTVWLTVLVTFTRYRSVCTAGRRKANTTNPWLVVRAQAFLVVVSSVVYNIPRFFEHMEISRETVSTYGINKTNCSSVRNHSDGQTTVTITTEHISFNLGDSLIYQVIYSNILYFPVMYIIPLLSLGYMNAKLIRMIGALRVRRESLTGHKCRRDYITHCIVIIVCVFLVCQTPALINQIFWAVTSKEDRKCGHFHFYYTKISDVLVVLNSSTNFIVYCLFGRSFRKIFLDTLCVKKVCGRGISRSSGTTTEHQLQDVCALCRNFRDDGGVTTDGGGRGFSVKGSDVDGAKCSCRLLLTNGAPTKSTNVDHFGDKMATIVENTATSSKTTLLIPRR